MKFESSTVRDGLWPCVAAPVRSTASRRIRSGRDTARPSLPLLLAENSVKALAFFAAALVLLAGTARAGQSKHRIHVTFDYNFKNVPPCSAKRKTKCVEQFVVYDISAGVAHRTKLMTIPVPTGAHGKVKGISATTPLLLFESGKHLIAVVAQSPQGAESDPVLCRVWVTIP